MRVKEVEIQAKDMRGNIIKTFWHIVENPIASAPEIFSRMTGRYRYRDITYTDNESEVEIKGGFLR